MTPAEGWARSRRLTAIQFIHDVLEDAHNRDVHAHLSGADALDEEQYEAYLESHPAPEPYSLAVVGTLQELIDLAADHNDQMLDALEVVDPGTRLMLSAYMSDEGDAAREASYALLNELFWEVREVLMDPQGLSYRDATKAVQVAPSVTEM